MSEYQYYEFRALDRPLSEKEIEALRACSGRAEITRTSFVNEYSWGNFRGNAAAWMEKYFDAHLYVANRGTRVLSLRLPSRLLGAETALACCAAHGGSATVKEKEGRTILWFHSDEEGGDGWVGGEGRLAALLPARAQLASGDLRALYLAWLLRMQEDDVDDDEVEPPVPPGLARLDEALEELAGFLRVDEDLLFVAAQASVQLDDSGIRKEAIAAWVAELPSAKKDGALTSLLSDSESTVAVELMRRFRKERAADGSGQVQERRTVKALRVAAEARTAERERIEAERKAAERARKQREAAEARRRHLDSLAGRERQLWGEVGRLIAIKQPKPYDEAVSILVDPRDLSVRAGRDDFAARLATLRETNARKPTLLERLRKAGLVSQGRTEAD